MKFGFLALFLAFGAVAQAEKVADSQALFVMTNDHDSNTDYYGLAMSNGSPVGFVTVQNNQNDRGQVYNFADVAQPNGVVLLSRQGHNVIMLQGQLNRTGEGLFHFRYLSNGLTNQYSTCDFLLKKDGDAYYAQSAYTGARITNARIISWTLGLRTIQGICGV